MIYKQFKALNNEKLSSVGFGCWAIGGTWNNTEDQKSIETIKKAVELGINFLMSLLFMEWDIQKKS
ncbi:aldo/keto reductase (plasmid) [Cetobacterium somerae]